MDLGVQFHDCRCQSFGSVFWRCQFLEGLGLIGNDLETQETNQKQFWMELPSPSHFQTKDRTIAYQKGVQLHDWD